MKLLFKILLLGCLVTMSSCEDSNGENKGNGQNLPPAVVDEHIKTLWSTSCTDVSVERIEALRVIQRQVDDMTNSFFGNYLKTLDMAAVGYERDEPLLKYYRQSFERIVEDVRTLKVATGSVAIWSVYNMGYVVKTPSVCFAIDIFHKYAEKLEPYLDFMCITHNHSDHYSKPLIDKMLAANKPVLSNYINAGSYQYTSTTPTNYTIGKLRITTNMNDQNSELRNFVTTYQINCGSDAADFVLMHVGDSSFDPKQYNVVENVDVFIPRYAPAGTENNIVGSIVRPTHVLLSHIVELSHVKAERWSWQQGLERAAAINCPNTYMPVWGERIIWSRSGIQ